MAKFILEMTCNNAAFADGMGAEIARILREMASHIEDLDAADGSYAQSVRDVNGNKVGHWQFEVEDEVNG